MPVYKRPNSSYWQIEFEVAGNRIRRSSGTTDRRAAEELEQSLRADVWRQLQLGERRHTWVDAVEKCRLEDGRQKSWDRTERALAVIAEYIPAETDLTEITYESLLKLRELLLLRKSTGNGWKNTDRPWKPSTANRVLAVIGSILTRCATTAWGQMLLTSPDIPLFKLQRTERRWITREQAHALLGRFPLHTRDLMILALATGLRKSNVAGLTWERIDFERRCCYVPGYETKAGAPIPVPLNEDALTVLRRWQAIHARIAHEWPEEVRRYVIVYRRRAPIQQVTTRMWRRECQAVGLAGVTFHTMRHSWASWQVQAGTPLRILQEMGGWASLQMPAMYSHLDPGHLADYADRTLLGDSRALSPTPGEKDASDGSDDPQEYADFIGKFGGKGGNRTLDPGIMSAVL